VGFDGGDEEVHVIRPARLRPGDALSVVAPAGPVARDRFAAGAKILGSRYRLVHDERIFTKTGYFAGSDDERLRELSAALADPSTKAVICARGGYGLTRILGGLDAKAFAGAPKPIVGFSDVTALHAWAARAGVGAIHGPVVGQLGDLPAEDAASLFAALESADPPAPLGGLRVLRGGRAEGVLLGGNLEIVSRLAGTPWQFDLNGAVLLLEDVGERPYRIDRALTQLELAGGLRGVAGVILGDFIGCAEKDGSPPSAEEVIVERLGRLGVPIVAGAPIGHGQRNRAVPLGARVRLDGATVTFLEAALG
jgi:muramoyltetrapeptide carboxypeptidase